MYKYITAAMSVGDFIDTAQAAREEIATRGSRVEDILKQCIDKLNEVNDLLQDIDTSEYLIDEFQLDNPEDAVENFMYIPDEDADVCYEDWEDLMSDQSLYTDLLDTVDELREKVNLDWITYRWSFD